MKGATPPVPLEVADPFEPPTQSTCAVELAVAFSALGSVSDMLEFAVQPFTSVTVML